MQEWTEEQRASAAKGFRQTGGSWHASKGLTDPRGPLWYLCLGCRRLRTIEKVADSEPGGNGGVRWRGTECGWLGAAVVPICVIGEWGIGWYLIFAGIMTLALFFFLVCGRRGPRLRWRWDEKDTGDYPPGHCQGCGCDLTGNLSGVCPECGAKREDG